MSVCRFHDLAEFDESKRSCRRRLAGHNERRRKSNPEASNEGSTKGHHPKETTHCRLANERERIQMNLPGSSGYKSFNIRWSQSVHKALSLLSPFGFLQPKVYNKNHFVLYVHMSKNQKSQKLPTAKAWCLNMQCKLASFLSSVFLIWIECLFFLFALSPLLSYRSTLLDWGVLLSSIGLE